jgi:uncharacterized protein
MPYNAINWFEIPVADMDRAMRFYSTIFAIQLEPMDAMGSLNAFFPMEPGGVGGSLTKADGYTPSQEGTVIYLNGGDNLSTVLDRVEEAGGQVVMPKMSIGENGYMAFILDTEGNKIGLHSQN